MAKIRCLFIVVSGLLGCFNPNTQGVTFTCSEQNRYCPLNLACVDDVCVDPYAPQDAGAADLGPGNTQADLAKPSGCASGQGTQIGAAFACPGSFQPGQASSRCAAGFTPCTSAAGLGLATCMTLPGFFLASVVGRYATPGDLKGLQCTGSDYYRAVFGCGNPAKAKAAATSCSSFTQIMDCRDIGSDFQCPPPPFDGIDNMTNPYPLDGVLCCAKP